MKARRIKQRAKRAHIANMRYLAFIRASRAFPEAQFEGLLACLHELSALPPVGLGDVA